MLHGYFGQYIFHMPWLLLKTIINIICMNALAFVENPLISYAYIECKESISVRKIKINFFLVQNAVIYNFFHFSVRRRQTCVGRELPPIL